MDHGGIDLIALGSVLRGGLSRGGSTIPMQLLKNLVFHDLQRRDVLSKLDRGTVSSIWPVKGPDEDHRQQRVHALFGGDVALRDTWELRS